MYLWGEILSILRNFWDFYTYKNQSICHLQISTVSYHKPPEATHQDGLKEHVNEHVNEETTELMNDIFQPELYHF